jgi:LysR family glycine cleavage system transcriptional activator
MHFYASVTRYSPSQALMMRRKIPSTQALICFEAAAKHLSFSHAAQALYMSQSALSRQIQQLEDFLQLKLFLRGKHGVQLSPAGRDYYQHISPHLAALEHSTCDLISHQGLGGSLKLGVVPTFASRWLLPRLSRFNQLHPEINIHLETRTQPFLFSEQLFDGAIFAGTPEQISNWPGTRAIFLMSEEVVPVCADQLIQRHFPATDAALSIAQLAQLPLLQQSTRPQIWADFFQTAAYPHPQPLKGQSYELFSMLAIAASHALGVALIPAMLIEKELQSGELKIASSHRLAGKRAYYFIYSALHQQPLLETFADWLQQQLHHPTCHSLAD